MTGLLGKKIGMTQVFSEDGKPAEYKRYAVTKSGVSPRAFPGPSQALVVADADEHNEEGHITEDADMRIKMVEKRFYKKLASLTGERENPTAYNLNKADTVLLGFGSTYGVIKEACNQLGESFGFMHFPQVWPFPAPEAKLLLKGKKNIFTVENNAAGQLARLLMRETGIKVKQTIQVLGCTQLKSNLPIILIGSGKFHALNLALQKC